MNKLWNWYSITDSASVVAHGYVDGILTAIVRRNFSIGGYTVTVQGEDRNVNSIRNAKRTAERIVRAKLKVVA